MYSTPLTPLTKKQESTTDKQGRHHMAKQLGFPKETRMKNAQTTNRDGITRKNN